VQDLYAFILASFETVQEVVDYLQPDQVSRSLCLACRGRGRGKVVVGGCWPPSYPSLER